MTDYCSFCAVSDPGGKILAEEYCKKCNTGICEDCSDEEGYCPTCLPEDAGESLHDEDCAPNCDNEDHWLPQGPGTTIVRTEIKVGRNDPCPCSSGKKYKKCCL